MDRTQLLAQVAAYVECQNSPTPESDTLSKIMSKEVSLPYPSPGVPLPTTGFNGIAEITKTARKAFPDYKLEVKQTVIDTEECRVVVLLQVTGTHTGYAG